MKRRRTRRGKEKRKVSREEEGKKERREGREKRKKEKRKPAPVAWPVSLLSGSRTPKAPFGSQRAESSGPPPVPRLHACNARRLARRQATFGSGSAETQLSARSDPTAPYYSKFRPPRTNTRNSSINSYYLKKNLFITQP